MENKWLLYNNVVISWETHVILKTDALEFYFVEPEENNPEAL